MFGFLPAAHQNLYCSLQHVCMFVLAKTSVVEKTASSIHLICSDWALAVEAENMSYYDLKEVTDGLTLRTIPATASRLVQEGCFDWLSFPNDELNSSESPMVHFYDVNVGYQGETDFHALGTAGIQMQLKIMACNSFPHPLVSRSKSLETLRCRYGHPEGCGRPPCNPQALQLS